MLVVTATALLVALTALPAHARGGDLDPTFSDDGVTRADFSPGFDAGLGMALQPDGKIVVVGQGGGTPRFALARFGPSGSLDRGFGTGGKVQTDFTTEREWATDVAIQPDGKILAVGVAWADQERFAVARYRANGSPDTDFSGDGRLRTSFGSVVDAAASAVAVQQDGKIVVAGAADDEFGLARYNPDGELDPSFGGEGQVTTGGALGGASDLLIQPDGQIVAVGSTRSTPSRFGIARYRPNGTLDPTFGSHGIVTTQFGPTDAGATAVARQANGDIVVAGSSGLGDDPDFALARYHRDGELDPTFGSGGLVTTQFGDSGQEWAAGVAIQADRRIVAVGTAVPEMSPCGAAQELALARYRPNGTLDPAFGTGGLVTTEVDGGSDEGHAVAVQPDGKIVAAGLADGCGNGKFVVVRYLPS
jgi:uncharacterized delta-60 repeat protein